MFRFCWRLESGETYCGHGLALGGRDEDAHAHTATGLRFSLAGWRMKLNLAAIMTRLKIMGRSKKHIGSFLSATAAGSFLLIPRSLGIY